MCEDIVTVSKKKNRKRKVRRPFYNITNFNKDYERD